MFEEVCKYAFNYHAWRRCWVAVKTLANKHNSWNWRCIDKKHFFIFSIKMTCIFINNVEVARFQFIWIINFCKHIVIFDKKFYVWYNWRPSSKMSFHFFLLVPCGADSDCRACCPEEPVCSPSKRHCSKLIFHLCHKIKSIWVRRDII